MVAEPDATPVTRPEPSTVAKELFDDVHEPPETVSDKEIEAPTQTEEAPVTVPAKGAGSTVTVFVAIPLPHALDSEYEISTVPAETPVTIPVLPTVAIAALDDDQVPPVVVLLKVMVLPAHTKDAPVIVPADDNGLTVTFATRKHPETA
jgi:hypothetical protein